MTTTTPLSGLKLKVKVEAKNISITNTVNQIVSSSSIKEVTNYEYEVLENEKKRKILILKPEYLGVFVSDMRNIMKYSESSQYLDQNTKRGYNPKFTGV